MHTAPQRALDCRPGLGGLNQVYGPNRPTRSVWGICDKYINIFTRCTIRNQHEMDIIMKPKKGVFLLKNPHDFK